MSGPDVLALGSTILEDAARTEPLTGEVAEVALMAETDAAVLVLRAVDCEGEPADKGLRDSKLRPRCR